MPSPRKTKNLRSFLGLFNFYRPFIDNFTCIVHPLNRLLKKGTPDAFQLDDDHKAASNNLIDKVCSPPVLALPKANIPYLLECGGSDYRICCPLFQTQPAGECKLIDFWFRSLLPAEEICYASERECLAVVWALKTLRPYLMYDKFTVYTYHTSFHWLLTINDPSGIFIRCRLRLAEFYFKVKYKKGNANTQAYVVSLLNTMSETTPRDENDNIPMFLLDSVTLEL